MNFTQLEIFHTAAIKKNFSETAKTLHMSQPSVSMYIQQLEESLNTVLFKRTTKKIYLTPAGELLFQSAEAILNKVHDTRKQLQQLSESIHGNLIIGASLTIGEHILPYLFGAFKQQYPDVTIVLKIYNSEQIIKKLDNGEIHLGFIESMISYPEFVQEPFMEDELVIISSCTKPWTKNEYITPEQLFSIPFIIREKGSGTRQVMEETLKQNQLNPAKLQTILELENTESIKSAVESGMGISILSKAAVQKELTLPSLHQLSIDDITLQRSLYSIYKKHQIPLSGEAFLQFVQEHITDDRLPFNHFSPSPIPHQ
ncbi:selenium metabolism-associated LysR family transcriptional regulator [Pontibacillus salicampi]|uniref:selenium metabolism-associated LysR family transcriptional regulator n=1 Tax=Pontibacillus salicampi TaxID=1449801 RepID=UPI00366BB2AA